MKRFIAYFDFLGFGDFIDNNDLEEQEEVLEMIFGDLEHSLAQGRMIDGMMGMESDFEELKLNCLNFSDTIVFWTNNDSLDSLNELLAVSSIFNLRTIIYTFPVRGSIVHGEIKYNDYQESNKVGGLYKVNSIFGKGLISAYQKAESQNWAGTVIDKSLIDELKGRGEIVDQFLNKYAIKYSVPYKKTSDNPEEFVLRLTEGSFDKFAYKNLETKVTHNFSNHKKGVDDDSVQLKIKNTLDFLKIFIKR